MCTCDITKEEDLLELWHDLGKANKKEDQIILQEHLQCRDSHANWYSKEVLIMSPSLAKDLVNFAFLAADMDSITEGFHPFQIQCGSIKQWAAALENAHVFDLIESGSASITLSDWQMIKAKELQCIPTDFWELEHLLGLFGNMVDIAFGPKHAIAQEFCLFWGEFTCMQVRLHHEVNQLHTF